MLWCCCGAINLILQLFPAAGRHIKDLRSRKEQEMTKWQEMTRDDKRDPCGAMMPIQAMLERNECDDLWSAMVQHRRYKVKRSAAIAGFAVILWYFMWILCQDKGKESKESTSLYSALERLHIKRSEVGLSQLSDCTPILPLQSRTAGKQRTAQPEKQGTQNANSILTKSYQAMLPCENWEPGKVMNIANFQHVQFR